MRSLKYLSIRGDGRYPSISLAPEYSDQVENHTVLNALVATLVKYGISGEIEPYLSEEWTISENGLRWIFPVRKGFSCESGLEISASAFREALLTAFKANLRKSDRTAFNQLIGWKNFLDGRSELGEGIQVLDGSLVFNFGTKPAGLLNLLRMPYFGLWCPDNIKNRHADSADAFSSSGPYKIIKSISPSRLLLRIREDQPTFSPKAPRNIEIGYASLKELEDKSTPIIAKIVVDSVSIAVDGYAGVPGLSSILQGIALNTASGFFSDEHNRKVFARRLHSFKAHNSEKKFAKGFYEDLCFEEIKWNEFPDQYRSNQSTILEIAFQYAFITSEVHKFWEQLFHFVLSGVNYKIHYPDVEDQNWVRDVILNPKYNIRTTSVHTGPSYNLSTIQLMFGSKIGISFPDPSGEICKITQKYIENEMAIDGDYQRSFNRTLQKDNSIFPIFRARDEWLIADRIDLKTVPNSIVYPRFEAIRSK